MNSDLGDGAACGHFDWLLDYEDFAEFLHPEFTGHSYQEPVIVLGCGTSTVSERMFDAGFCNLTSIDRAPDQIESMRTQNVHRTGLRWVCGDATDATMILGQAVFNLAVDKGTLDAILCESVENAARYVPMWGIFAFLAFRSPVSQIHVPIPSHASQGTFPSNFPCKTIVPPPSHMPSLATAAAATTTTSSNTTATTHHYVPPCTMVWACACREG